MPSADAERYDLPQTHKIGALARSIGIGAVIGAIAGLISAVITAYPQAAFSNVRVPIPAALWYVLVAPFILRAFFTVGLQQWLERFGRVLAAVVTAVFEGWLFAQLAFVHLSTQPVGGWDHAAESRSAGALAIGPCLYAFLRFFGASYATAVSANAAVFLMLCL